MEISTTNEATPMSAAYPQTIIESKSPINAQSLLWTLIAVVLFIIYHQQDNKETTLGIIQISLVIVCVIMALVKMFVGNKKLIYQPTGSIVDIKTYSFNISLDSDIRQCLNEGNTSRLKALKTDNAGGLLVEVLESRDKTFTAARLCKYEPHGYEPKTEWVTMN